MRSISNVFKDINQPRRRTLEEISLLTLFSVKYLIVSTPNNLSSIRVKLVKKIRTIKEVFGVIGGKNKDVAITSL